MSEKLSNEEVAVLRDVIPQSQLENEYVTVRNELVHLRAVVANAVALINSGRCGLGHDVLITGKLNNE